MKVYVGVHKHCDGHNVSTVVEKVFGDEVRALLWVEDKTFLEEYDQNYDWRNYEGFELE